MAQSDWEVKVEAVEQAIREGKAGQARRELVRVAEAKPPREFWARLASQARRSGVPLVGLRVLNPVVRPPKGVPSTATPAETSEYAAALTRAGAVDEALTLLRSLSKGSAQNVPLFLAFALFTRWEYGAAIEPLRAYVADESLTPYARLVGKVNLAASLVSERQFAEADALLGELLEETARGGHGLLEGNCLELAAQNSLFRSDWSKARAMLGRAEKKLSGNETLDQLFVEKWKALADLLERGGSGPRRRALSEVRARAQKLSHWETLRDCDRFEAIGLENEALYRHVHFGTPYPAFRERLAKEFPHPVLLDDKYLWKLGGRASAGTLSLGAGTSKLKAGQLMHRALVALTDDFYRPVRLAALASKLYPGDYFNPVTTPLRVHQALLRVRSFFSRSRVPLLVEEKTGEYRLAAKRPFAIAVFRGRPLHTLSARRALLQPEFGAGEIEKAFGVSRSQAHRILREAIAERLVQPLGGGRSRRYRFL